MSLDFLNFWNRPKNGVMDDINDINKYTTSLEASLPGQQPQSSGLAGILKGAIGGGTTGASAGPWGALAGAVIGAGGAAINASDENADAMVTNQDRANTNKQNDLAFMLNQQDREQNRALQGVNMLASARGNAQADARMRAVRDALYSGR